MYDNSTNKDQYNDLSLTNEFQEQYDSIKSSIYSKSEFQNDKTILMNNQKEFLSQMVDVTIQRKDLKNKDTLSTQNEINTSNFMRSFINSDEKINFQEDEEDNNQNHKDQTLKKKIDQLFKNDNYIHNKYNYQKYKIYHELLNKNYTLVSYLESGGQSDIFEGFFQNKQGINENCIFKIYFETTCEEFQKEIEIMKSFQNPINVVKIIDSLQIEQICIIVLVKYEYSLRQELLLFKQRKLIFYFDKLLQIIFDLLDGLIHLRIYNILHLDIKPGNILKSKEGYYCFTDFGSSFNKKKNSVINVKYFTIAYASPELKNNSNKYINFKSDVYSLGKTFKNVIDIFKQVNQENEIKKREIVKSFEKIIEEHMILQDNFQRSECQNLHQQFSQQFKVEDFQEFSQNYLKKLNQIAQLQIYDSNKDIPYFFKLNLYYNFIKLNLINHFQNQQLFKKDQNKNIQIESDMKKNKKCFNFLESLELNKQIFHGNHPLIAASLNKVGLCYQNLGDYQNGMKYLLESLEMKKLLFLRNHPDIATSLNNIGICYQFLGDHYTSEQYQIESLEMRNQLFQGNHHLITTSLNNTGFFYQNIDGNQNDLEYYFESLEMMEQIFQRNYHDISTILNNIGQSHKNLSDNLNDLKQQLELLKTMKCIFQENQQSNQIKREKQLREEDSSKLRQKVENQKIISHMKDLESLCRQQFQQHIYYYFQTLNDLQIRIQSFNNEIEEESELMLVSEFIKYTNINSLTIDLEQTVNLYFLNFILMIQQNKKRLLT